MTTNASTLASTPGVATALNTAYTENCSSGASSAYQSFCTQYAAAASAGGSTTTMAQYFLTHLN